MRPTENPDVKICASGLLNALWSEDALRKVVLKEQNTTGCAVNFGDDYFSISAQPHMFYSLFDNLNNFMIMNS